MARTPDSPVRKAAKQATKLADMLDEVDLRQFCGQPKMREALQAQRAQAWDQVEQLNTIADGAIPGPWGRRASATG